MNSIDKLRTSLKACTKEAGVVEKFDTYWITADACDHLIDEIEAEIAANYLELPKDADGMPIHVGDKMFVYECEDDKPEIVKSVSQDRAWFDGSKLGIMGYNLLHDKPDPLKELLEEFLSACDAWDDWSEVDRKGARDRMFDEYADRIRDLLGGDAE